MTWTLVGTVESDSEPGVRHVVKRRDTDGHLGCDCTAYRFAPKAAKTCKHIRALAQAASQTVLARTGDAHRELGRLVGSAVEASTIVVGGEALRVRRAIRLE